MPRDLKTAERLAVEWVRAEGRLIDPDTDEVDWFDKRIELMERAFIAGYRASTVGRAEETNR